MEFCLHCLAGLLSLRAGRCWNLRRGRQARCARIPEGDAPGSLQRRRPRDARALGPRGAARAGQVYENGGI